MWCRWRDTGKRAVLKGSTWDRCEGTVECDKTQNNYKIKQEINACVHILSVQLTLSYKQSYLCNQMQSDTITLHNSNWIMFIRAVRKLLIQLYCHFVAVVLDIYSRYILDCYKEMCCGRQNIIKFNHSYTYIIFNYLSVKLKMENVPWPFTVKVSKSKMLTRKSKLLLR